MSLAIDDTALEASPATHQTFRLRVGGLNCANCARSAERALNAVDGVDRASVNFALERADIRAANSNLTLDDLTEALEQAGYEGHDWTEAQAGADDKAEDARRREPLILALSALLTIPLVLPMIFGVSLALPAWAQLLLAAPIQFGIGFRFYRGAYYSLRSGSSNMDVLVALGTSAAFIYSVLLIGLAEPGMTPHLYFEASAVIITLVLLGKWLESRAKKGASQAIRLLISLRPETARVRRGSETIEIPAEDVIIGDILLVKPGERVPVDGRVITGKSEVDAAHITGESLPVTVEAGDALYGGSLNGSGAMDIEATSGAGDSLLARIVDLVERAQGSKAPIERLVDRVSAVFVPTVIGIALVTLLVWLGLGAGFEKALISAVAVLVIACPCALGLATPTALVAGLGAAAKHGILIKDIEALERGAALSAIAFDKTGTLTEGKPQVIQVNALSGGEAELLAKAASLQTSSEHLLGEAMLRQAHALGLALSDISDFESFVGEGVAGKVAGAHIVVGNRSLMERHNIEVPMTPPLVQGATRVFVADDARVLGEIYIADQPRAASAEAVAALQSDGISVQLLSGDSQDTAEIIGEQLKVDVAKGGLKPQDKLTYLEALRGQDKIVGMVGDGINDAPALAAADVGIAMGGGTDVAIESASIALMRPDPRLVGSAIDISRATARKIRQNLGWAFVYNVIGIPLAAFGLLSPAFAAAAMAASSISVVSNSLLLRRWRPKIKDTTS